MEVEDLLNAKPIVIDNGSGFSKNGFAGEVEPRSVFSTLIGFLRYPADTEISSRKWYVGDEALQLSHIIEKRLFPIEHHIIWDWAAMEKIWHYTFYMDLRIDPSDHPVLLTEAPLNPRPNREKMAEIMFETFNVPALFVIQQPLLALYATGLTTGCVVYIGDGATYVVPVDRGLPVSRAVVLDLAGWDITVYLQRLLSQKGYNFETAEGRAVVRDIKEKVCYVALDEEKEIMLSKKVAGMEKTYTLPSGENITVGVERFHAPEAFFNPVLIGKSCNAIDDVICNTIKNCEFNLRRDLYANIVLAGGSSLFPGLKERLAKEIKEQIPESVDFRIIAPPDRAISSWLGGSILASRPAFQKMWVTRRDYQETGPEIVHRCF